MAHGVWKLAATGKLQSMMMMMMMMMMMVVVVVVVVVVKLNESESHCGSA